VAGAEEDFEVGVVLLEDAGEVGFKVGLVAVESFEDAYRGQVWLDGSRSGKAAETLDSGGYEEAEYRRRDDSEDGERAESNSQDVTHCHLLFACLWLLRWSLYS
jgi:hypothetical protein